MGLFNITVREVHIHQEASEEVKQAVATLPAILATLKSLNERSITMATAQDNAADALEAVGTKLDKISGETTGLVTANRELTAALAAALASGGTVTPRLQAAIEALGTKAEAIDAAVDDVAPNPTPTPPAPPEEPGPAEPGMPV